MLIPLAPRHYLDESLHESSRSEAAVSAEDLSPVERPWDSCDDNLTIIFSRLERASFENSKTLRKKIDPRSAVWSDVCQGNGICMRQLGIFGGGGCCTGIASQSQRRRGLKRRRSILMIRSLRWDDQYTCIVVFAELGENEPLLIR